MKQKNKLQVITSAVFITGAIIFLYSTSDKKIHSPAPPRQQQTPVHAIKPIHFIKPAICQVLKKTYANFNSLKKNNHVSLRFKNIHKQIGTNIYRLRKFFKDGDENEIETFLVYLEDAQENAKIVEKSVYKKGPFFLKIEQTKGQILYSEEGFNINENIFLHYINQQLVDADDALHNSTCHF